MRIERKHLVTLKRNQEDNTDRKDFLTERDSGNKC